MSQPQRLEAVGPRGEACIVLRTDVPRADGSVQPQWTLATGERLKPTEDGAGFETLDGKRRFTLRQ